MHVFLIDDVSLSVLGYSSRLNVMQDYCWTDTVSVDVTIITSADQLPDAFEPADLERIYRSTVNDYILVFDLDDEDALNDMADEIWDHLINNILEYDELPKPPKEKSTLEKEEKGSEKNTRPGQVQSKTKATTGENLDVIENVVVPSDLVLKIGDVEITGYATDEPIVIEPIKYKVPSRGTLDGVRFQVGDYVPGKKTHYWILYIFVRTYHLSMSSTYPIYSVLVHHFLANYAGKTEPKDEKLAAKFIRGAVRRGFISYKLR